MSKNRRGYKNRGEKIVRNVKLCVGNDKMNICLDIVIIIIENMKFIRRF